MKKAIFLFFIVGGVAVHAQTVGLFAEAATPGERLAATVVRLWPESNDPDSSKVRWTYDEGVVWKGMEGLWLNTGDARWYKYVQHQMDKLVNKEGDIRTYKLDDYNLDNVLCGRVLLMLYKVTGQEKYYRAAGHLREQLASQPRTSEGSFWHKKKYVSQVWLDGLYMAQPFFAEWAELFHEDSVFGDITRQFVAIEKHARDGKTGLLYHGWDESKNEKWADKETGHSPNFWARAMGWYGMALVDVLEHDRGRKELVDILRRYAAAIVKVQDPASGCWWDILDKPGAQGNYPEASASSMFVYTLAKGVRLGYLPESYLGPAKKGYDGIVKKFLVTGPDGAVNLEGTVSVSGLGGNPYRDGSYAYYIGEKVVQNDPKGIGAFLLAAGEMDVLSVRGMGKGKTVLLDYYFNSERHKDITGTPIRYHYIWGEMDNNGYSLWGHLFRQYGMVTDSLPVAPTAAGLKKASVYIIVDPDNERESPVPNFIQDKDIDAIEAWVKAGGVLVLMGNDSANMEFTHFNRLAERFGIKFNFDDYHKVTGSQYEMGAFTMKGQEAIFPTNQMIFKTTNKFYIKELSTLKLSGPAKAHFTDKGNVIIATAKIGRGTVFAVGDPWFYNEYTDGRKLPADFENYNAARDVTQWLIKQTNTK